MATHASCAIRIITANPLFGDGEHAISLNERLGPKFTCYYFVWAHNSGTTGQWLPMTPILHNSLLLHKGEFHSSHLTLKNELGTMPVPSIVQQSPTVAASIPTRVQTEPSGVVFDDDPFAAITEIAGGTTQKKNFNSFSIFKLCCGRERVFQKHFRGPKHTRMPCD
jgi:hypothetical protein